MSVRIIKNCIDCGACIWECPTEAIAPGDPHPVVDEAKCTECHGSFGESQCIVVCPARAIVVTPEPVAQLAAKYAAQLPDRPPTDLAIWRRIGPLDSCAD